MQFAANRATRILGLPADASSYLFTVTLLNTVSIAPLIASFARPAFTASRRWAQLSRVAAVAVLTLLFSNAAWAQRVDGAESKETSTAPGGPVRLQGAQPNNPNRQPQGTAQQQDMVTASDLDTTNQTTPYIAGEFERYVQSRVGLEPRVRRLGAELITGGFDGKGADLSPVVPDDYSVSTGDEVLVTLWGSVDADLRLVVDRAGRINIPRVGAIQVAGVKHGELKEVITKRIAQVFKNFEVSVSLGQLRGIRVFVTGQAARPGLYVVNSLSTILSTLMRAGGPAASGSFRDIELRRGAKLVQRFDLYDLLAKGDRSSDQTVQSGDVIHVGAVGNQVGVIGSVNKPAVVELRAGETLADALRFVGGFSAVADRTRVAVERLQDRLSSRVVQVDLPLEGRESLASGDLVRAMSGVEVVAPLERQNRRVRVEGEVIRPGEYILPAASTMKDAVAAAGGFTTGAFLFATELSRESVRQSQQQSYDRALRDLETDLARASSSRRVSNAEEAAAQRGTSDASNRLIERLRSLKPTGRVVMQLATDAANLPDLALEDGDRIYVPSRPTTVGVFGSVFNAATYLHQAGRTLDDYMRLAGGSTKGADEASAFVIRANGQVVSSRQGASFFGRGSRIGDIKAEAGDTVFVPEETDKTTLIQNLKDWSQILSQFGLGLAAIKVLGN
jgi:protein involved in polysaccharide export with SLBB domain